jgi:hypothetical protein
MSLLRMGKETKASPEAVIEKAISFFGKEGVGLRLVQRSTNSVHFTLAGGHVQVVATPISDGRKTDVDVQTREWEYDVKRFMTKL